MKMLSLPLQKMAQRSLERMYNFIKERGKGTKLHVPWSSVQQFQAYSTGQH